jgi:hypothetical protein
VISNTQGKILYYWRYELPFRIYPSDLSRILSITLIFRLTNGPRCFVETIKKHKVHDCILLQSGANCFKQNQRHFRVFCWKFNKFFIEIKFSARRIVRIFTKINQISLYLRYMKSKNIKFSQTTTAVPNRKFYIVWIHEVKRLI